MMYCITDLVDNFIFNRPSEVCTLLGIFGTNGQSDYWCFGLLVFRTNGASVYCDVPTFDVLKLSEKTKL